MSTFYGMVEGNRSCATRGGSKASGYRASAQSYDGSVIVTLRYNDNNQLMVNVGTSDGSSCYMDWDSKRFYGTFEEFKQALELLQDIKDKKVSVVRHRQKQ